MGFRKTALFSVLCWAWQRSLLIAKAEVPACSFNQGLRGWKTTERGVLKGPNAGERNGLHPKDCLSQWADQHKLFPVSLQILTEIKIVSCETQFLSYAPSNIIRVLKNPSSKSPEVKLFLTFNFFFFHENLSLRSLIFGYSWKIFTLKRLKSISTVGAKSLEVQRKHKRLFEDGNRAGRNKGETERGGKKEYK